MSHNKLRSLDSFIFGFLNQLNELNLAANDLSVLNENCFINNQNLLILRLGFNQIKSINFLESNKNELLKLELIDLEHNKTFMSKEIIRAVR